MAQPAEQSKALSSPLFQSKYRFLSVIGKGSFGEALLVRSLSDGKRYVAKTVESATMTEKERHDLQNEIRILANVRHPNIVRYKEHFVDNTLVFIIMEYADGGDLSTRIKDAKKSSPAQLFDPDRVMFWFLQLCMAVQYLHDNHILHRDIKTANVFLTRHDIVKLGDFGISTVLQNTMACAKTVCGTPYYFSPELCQNKMYNNKSDIWALGVVFYEALTLQRPFNARSLKELVKKVVVGQYEPIPSSVPTEMRALCASLLQIEPTMRPSIHRILEAPYVQDKLSQLVTVLTKQTERYHEHKAQGGATHHGSAAAAATTDKDKNKDSKDNNAPTPSPRAAPGTTSPPPAPAPPSQPAPPRQLSDREQMQMLRGMKRENMRAMLAQQAAEANAQPPTTTTTSGAASPMARGAATPTSGHASTPTTTTTGGAAAGEVDDDVGAAMAEKQTMATQAKNIIGHPSRRVDGSEGAIDDDFSETDGTTTASVAAQTQSVTLPSGVQLPAAQARAALEAELGKARLDEAVELFNRCLVQGIASVDTQNALNTLLTPRFADYSNAITRLAVWESRQPTTTTTGTA